jgi:hypothetical protein
MCGVAVGAAAMFAATTAVNSKIMKKHAAHLDPSPVASEPEVPIPTPAPAALGSPPSTNEGAIARTPVQVGQAPRPAPGPMDYEREPFSEATYRTLRLTQHDQERANPHWAKATERVLFAELSDFGHDAGFDVSNIDCRSTTCVATLKWSSYSDAQQAAAKIVERRYSKKCGKELFLAPTEGSSSSYEASLLLDCESDL